MLLSILFFILAGLAEIGGGIIPTFQPEASFGKVYAAYGGVFIALSILWGWLVDGLRPDMYDIIGGLVCLVGVYIIMYAPR